MNRLAIDFLVEYDDESLLAELRRIAQVTGSDTVTKADLKRVQSAPSRAVSAMVLAPHPGAWLALTCVHICVDI